MNVLWVSFLYQTKQALSVNVRPWCFCWFICLMRLPFFMYFLFYSSFLSCQPAFQPKKTFGSLSEERNWYGMVSHCIIWPFCSLYYHYQHQWASNEHRMWHHYQPFEFFFTRFPFLSISLSWWLFVSKEIICNFVVFSLQLQLLCCLYVSLSVLFFCHSFVLKINNCL